MKTFSQLLAIAAITVGTLSTVQAAEFTGRFEIKTVTYHKIIIKGVINAKFDSTTCAVGLVTDEPVKGETNFPSVEQFCVQSADAKSIGLAFKVDGPPHKWYYVEVATLSEDGKTFNGVFYKVPAPLEDIQKILMAGSPTDPAGWKKVGAGTLTSTQP